MSKNFQTVGLVLLALGLSVFLCFKAASGIFTSWTMEEYSYAYFVLPLAVWIGLHRLSKSPVSPGSSWIGVCLVLFSLGFGAVGEVSDIPNLPQYALLGLIYGIFLAALGWPFIKVAGVALAYLFFAIPLPQTFYLSLSAKMQLISSDLGVVILSALGIPVFQDGNIIDLGGYKLQVAEACNGLRYLFPLLSFGYLFALLLEDALWKRVVIFMSAVPAAIGLNTIRIASVGMIASWGSPEAAVELVHDIEGWIAFLVCILLLWGEVEILLRIPPHGSFAGQYVKKPKPPYFLRTPRLSVPALAVLAVLTMASVAQAFGALAPKEEVVPMRENFASFPMNLEGWTGRAETLPPEALDLLKATDTLSVLYENFVAKKSIGLYVAYYDSQRSERTFHSPSVCLPGSGWQEISASVAYVRPDPSKDIVVNVNRLVVEKGAYRQLVYYWFEQRGVSEPNFHRVKARIIKDSIFMGRTDGAIVRFITAIAAAETEAEADIRLTDFMRLTSPLLKRYIPNYSLEEQALP